MIARVFMAAACLPAALCAYAQTPPPAQDFETFFKRFSEQRAAIKVLSARFTQTTVLPEETLTTTGTLKFAQPRRFVIRTEEPRRETLLDHRRGYEYEAELEQVLVFDIADDAEASIFFLGFDEDAAALRMAYDVTLFETQGAKEGKLGVAIKPKEGAGGRRLFEQVDLYLRDSDTLPYRIRIVNDAESTVILDMTAIDVNAEAHPVAPDIQVPEGVKIVLHDDVIETVGPGGKRLPEAVPITVPLSASEDLPPPGAPAAAPAP